MKLKCPNCLPLNYPFPICRQTGVKDYLQCPICKVLFDNKGKEVKLDEIEPEDVEEVILRSDGLIITV